MSGYTQAFANVNKLNLSYTIDNLCAFRRKHQDTIQIAILLYVQLDIFMLGYTQAFTTVNKLNLS